MCHTPKPHTPIPRFKHITPEEAQERGSRLIQKARLSKGLSLSEAARHLNMAYNDLLRMEEERKHISVYAYIEIMEGYGLRAEDALSDLVTSDCR